MKQWIVVLVLLLGLMVGTAGAEGFKSSFDFGVGYRTDNLDWNIAVASIDPLSELEWSNLDILYSKASIRMSYKKFYARGSLGYGWILEGDNRDSDWAVSGRQAEFSRSNNKSNSGHVFDASMGIGYQFKAAKWSITPLIGYSWHLQYLRTTNGMQTIATPGVTPPLGPFDGLDSWYNPDWQGPWVGVDLTIQPSDKMRFFTTFEYHLLADYKAKANWNLRPDLAHPTSFVHFANADGFVMSGGFAYAVKDNWDIGFELQYTDWETEPGIHRIFLADGLHYADAILNEVNWKSLSVMLNATYRFHQIKHKRFQTR